MSSEEKRESGDVAPNMKPEERPNLQTIKTKNQQMLILVKTATRYFLAQKT
jgi:hypothetical protein